jgi:hypothetical protein
MPDEKDQALWRSMTDAERFLWMKFDNIERELGELAKLIREMARG